MTSVPKPLKFLRTQYPALKACLEALPTGAPNRQPLADVVRCATAGALFVCVCVVDALPTGAPSR